jgi:hypothetical protein
LAFRDGAATDEIAGDLFANELIEGKVAVERVDDIIAIAPCLLEDQSPQGDRFAEPGDVQPVTSPALAETG